MNKKILFIPLFLAIILISGALYLLMNNSENDFENCEGALIDTHAHFDDDDSVEKLVGLMNSNNVGCSVVFTYGNPDDPLEVVDDLKADTELDRLIPFFHVDPKVASDVSMENMKKVLDATEIYKGFGEVGLYRDPMRQSSLQDPNWKEVFTYAASEDIFIMIHLRDSSQTSQLESALVEFPNTKVLLHGTESFNELPRLLTTYTNLYFTLDTAALITINESIPGGLMFNTGSSTDFLEKLNANKAGILDYAVGRWTPIIASAPDRVMWGTDIAYEWHFEEEVYSALVSFSNEFIARLPEEYSDNYAFGNAKRLFVD